MKTAFDAHEKEMGMRFKPEKFDNYQEINRVEYFYGTSRSKASYEGEVGIVYSIECLDTWNVYVGQTSCHFRYQKVHGGFKKLARILRHRNDLNKGIHSSREMQHDWSNCGENAFLVTCLEIIPIFKTGSMPLIRGSNTALRKLEAKWHLALNATYSSTSWSKSSRSLNNFCDSYLQATGVSIDFGCLSSKREEGSREV